MRFLNYKGYTGSIEYSVEDSLLYGKVLGIQALISYEGISGKDLEDDFKESIDLYFEECKSSNRNPEKAYKGSFNVRISANLHYKAALLAMEKHMSLNNFVGEAIRSSVLKNSK